jgi:DNA-3-methyladenine glycosylase I
VAQARCPWARNELAIDYHDNEWGVPLHDERRHNARGFLAVVDEFGSFDSYAWGFVGGKPRINRYRRMADVPAATPESEAFSKDLRKRRFRFVGPVICYALMQATGMVNDHLTSCPRWRELGGRPRN